MAEKFKNGQKVQKWPKSSKMAKKSKNGQKFKNGQKLQKWQKSSKNDF